jgi:YVTN family beta-propeller protein
MRLLAIALFLLPLSLVADERDRMKVGLQPDGRIVVPTNQILQPAGKQVTFPGRPVDLTLTGDGKSLVVKSMRELLVIDVATGTIKQRLTSATAKTKSAGFCATGLVVRGPNVFVTDSQNLLQVAAFTDAGKLEWSDSIPLERPAVGGHAHPTGLAFLNDEQVFVTTTRGSCVQLVNLKTKKVEQVIPVGVAPYTVVVKDAKTAYVSNWGGDPPKPGDPQAPSSGTPVRIDPRTHIANHGSVSVLALGDDSKWKQSRTIEVGGHSSGMTLNRSGQFLYVANANSDTISVIDTTKGKVVETIGCKPDARLPFGSGANAVTLSKDEQTLFVANGTNNCVGVIQLGSLASGPFPAGEAFPSRIAGFIPTGWYPGAVAGSSDGKKLFVANVKGHGALDRTRRTEDKGFNSHDHLGSVSIIDVPDEAALRIYSETVRKNNRHAYSIVGMEKPREDAKPAVVPARHGEPSLFEHVVYVIKENRTYDQVFGDVKEGNGNPKLCIFGEEVTPNQHKLAREFTLFDNYYCSGVLSADGHSWVNEAYVTDYLEKSFGGFTRSYPYEGSDALAFPTSGALWDNALLNKRTFRNYGEHVKTTYEPKNAKWSDVYADYKNGTSRVKIAIEPNVKLLKEYSHGNYPGFPLTTPDVVRAKLFLADLDEYEKQGKFPNLTYIFLPNNHTSGTNPGMPTPRAMVADNDLALGRVIDALTRSKFWPKMCIIVIEDDPQNGFDHVDGHRSPCLVISPYTKRRYVDSTCYNQTGVVKTIELMLRLPPMNQMDLSASPLVNCFTDKADLTPYQHVPNRIPIDEMNKPMKELKGKALEFARKSMELDFSKEDQADEDTLNRILWFAQRGDAKYPKDE